MPLPLQIEDWVRGSRKNNFYNSYHTWLRLFPEEIRSRQLEKLQKLVQHAYRHIPWYRNVFDQAGLKPQDIRSQDDLRNLPPLTREAIRDQAGQMIWPGFKGKVLKGSSSGTTGIPITYYQDMNAMSAGTAAGVYMEQMCGLIPGMRNVHVWGNKESIQQWNTLNSWLKQKVNHRKNIAATLLNDPANIPDVVRQIRQFRPQSIDGYPNSLFAIAQYLHTHKIRIPSLRLAFTTAENLEPHHEELIEQTLAPVSDMYGCSEINGIAIRPATEKRYYIFEPHVIVETVPLPGQPMQEILVTDLDNYYMPLIRYKIGDLIDGVRPGSAGNPFPFAYFTKIYGRSSDRVVLPNGLVLFPVNIFGGTLYRKYPQITRHRVTWNKQFLKFEFEANGSLNREALEADVKRSLTGYPIAFQVHYTHQLLPVKSGKYQYFVVE